MTPKYLGYRFMLLLALLFSLNINAKEELEDNPEADAIRYYDFIIIGVGSAGSILARKLSDEKSCSVLALDIGEFRYHDPLVNAANLLADDVLNNLFTNPKYAKVYPVTVGLLEVLPYSEGSGTIGGGGAHNFLLAVRGTPGIYNSWAQASNDPRWLYNSLLPKMIALETYTPFNSITFDPTQRGSRGPIKITQDPPITGQSFFQNLATVSGSAFSEDYNNPNYPNSILGNLGLVIGANQNTVTPGADSQRSYSALEYLPMDGPTAVIDAHGNGLHGRKLKVVSNARALSFKIKDGRAISVDYVYTFGAHSEALTASLNDNGKLILAAGSVQTPKLLMQSGVGPAQELRSLGIKPIVDSPQVGQNVINQWGPSVLINTGTTNVSPGDAFINGTPYTLITPTNPNMRRIQIISLGGAPNPFAPGNFVLPAFTVLLEPNSRGSINNVSKNPLLDPQLNLNMYDPTTGQNNFAVNGTDANLVVSALKIIRDAAVASGFSMINPSPAIYAAGDAALYAYATNLQNWQISSHIVGTARMGTDISNGVVDGSLKVFGLDNVYIGDNSVQPKIIDGNTNLGAYYIALELASILGFPTPPPLR